MAYGDNPLSLPVIATNLAGWSPRMQQAFELLAPMNSLYRGATLILTTHANYVDCKKPVLFPSYAKASLPSATPAGQQIYVTDDVGGAIMAQSDGTNWRRLTDRNVIS